MPRVALWTFDETPGSSAAVDTETSDGVAQNGIFQNGATTTGTGSGVFDGSNDFVEVPYDPGFDLNTGSIVITFTQDTASVGNSPSVAMTLFSHDSSGFDNGGHLSIFIRADGSIGVRHQDTSQSFNFVGGNVVVGQSTTVVYTWSPTGSQLIVDGVVVDTGTQALTLVGDPQPITIGASQVQSSDGIADNLKGYFDGKIDGVAIYDEVVSAGTVPCFTAGTLILTPEGYVQIEDLQVGDLVCTMHNGPQPIRWIGSRRIDLTQSATPQEKLCPVRIRAGALGQGLPEKDLRVSRQHRMLVSSKIAARMFGGKDVLISAIKLTEIPGIFVDESVTEVEYFHLLFDRHEVIYANAAPAESLFMGAEALKCLPLEAREEILTLFPEFADEDWMLEPVHSVPHARQQKQLVARHAKNSKPLLESYSMLR